MSKDGEASGGNGRREDLAGQFLAFFQDLEVLNQEFHLLASDQLDAALAAMERRAEDLRRICVQRAGDRGKVPGVPQAEGRA